MALDNNRPVSKLFAPSVQIPRPASQSELADLEVVRKMQIRTEACKIAAQIAGFPDVAHLEFTMIAAQIAAYIETGET